MIDAQQHVELTIGRPIVQGGQTIDYGEAPVRLLCFFVNYSLKGDDARQYSEPAVCWSPQWVDEKTSAEKRESKLR